MRKQITVSVVCIYNHISGDTMCQNKKSLYHVRWSLRTSRGGSQGGAACVRV